jgi:hypothetical protein
MELAMNTRQLWHSVAISGQLHRLQRDGYAEGEDMFAGHALFESALIFGGIDDPTPRRMAHNAVQGSRHEDDDDDDSATGIPENGTPSVFEGEEHCVLWC